MLHNPNATENPTFRQALQHHQAGRLAQAGALYQQLIALDPRDPDALHMLGILLSQLGHNDLAAGYLRQAIAAAPKNASFHSELAELLRRLGQLDAAAAACRHALTLDPKLVDAHYNLGVILQQQRQLDDAIAFYRRALDLQPKHPAALYNLANALKDQGRLPEAIAHYRQALALQPDDPETLGNLGIALHQAGDLDAAIASFQRVLALRPSDPIAHAGLANALRDQSRASAASPTESRAALDAAIASYRRAIALDPNFALAHSNLGQALESAGLPDEALACYRQAVALGSPRPEPYQNLALALEKLGQRDEAIALFKQALARGPLTPEAHYHIASVTGLAIPPAAPPSHIVTVFNDLANTYDHHLVDQLHYRGPELLHAALLAATTPPPPANSPLPSPNFGDILDLGCGTGLCAPLFRPHARSLTGIDLAPAMIAKAQARNLYTHLHVTDILPFLLDHPDSFDLVLAADVLVYFGDLAPLFAAVAAALRPHGLFALTVEALTPTADFPASPGYVLRPTRRYAHSAAYLRSLAATHAFTKLSLISTSLREENLQPVPALIHILQKPR